MAKVSKTKIDAIIKEYSRDPEIIPVNLKDGKVVEIIVKRTIPYTEFMCAVKEFVERQFAKNDENTLSYIPALRPLVEWYVILKYFTNIDVEIDGGVLNPGEKCTDRLWALRYCDNLYGRIYDVIRMQWYMIYDIMDETIENTKDQMKPGISLVSKALSSFLESAQKQFEKYDEDDWDKFLAGISKLNNIDDGKIIQFIKNGGQVE